MDNLDRFQKLVSTRWTFLISISIGLERRDPQAYLNVHFKTDDSSNISIRQTSLKLRELVQMIISMISFESYKQI